MKNSSSEIDTPALTRKEESLQVRRILRGRFALLFVFLLGFICMYPYAASSGIGFYGFRILSGLVVVLTLYAVTFRRGLFVLLLILAVPTLVQHLFLQQYATGALPFTSRLLSLIFDAIVIGIIFRHVFRTARPDSETIFGALCVYLLLGFFFASLYAAIGHYATGAFYLTPAVNLHTKADPFDYLYFSFGTLTELGAPGVTAVLPIARALSLLEAITGILYLAVLISRLLSAYQSVQRAADPH